MRLHCASCAQCDSVSATVSGEPQMMRPIETMSSHVARVPSASAADWARRRNSLRDTYPGGERNCGGTRCIHEKNFSMCGRASRTASSSVSAT